MQVDVRIMIILACDEIAEADRGERNEAVIERVEVRPFLLHVEQRRHTAGNDRRGDEQYHHHPVDRRFPVGQIVVVIAAVSRPTPRIGVGPDRCLAVALLGALLLPAPALVDRSQHQRQYGNDALEKQVYAYLDCSHVPGLNGYMEHL